MAILTKFKAKMDYSATDDKKEPSDWPNGEPKSVRKAEGKIRR